MSLAVLWKVGTTFVATNNVELIICTVIHAVGNFHVFKGTDDFNNRFVRSCWAGFGLSGNMLSVLVLTVLWEVDAKIIETNNLKVSSDRRGLVRNAVLIVIHAGGNLHEFKGADDVNVGRATHSLRATRSPSRMKAE